MISSKIHCHNANDHVTHPNITFPRKRFYSVGQRKETNPLPQKLKSVSNNMQPGLQRWFSLPALNYPRRRSEHFHPGITESTLRRTKGWMNINSNCQDHIKLTVPVVYQRMENTEKLDAENYVYLGSMKKTALLQQGMTLDDQGNLLLVKGKSKNLFKQALAKLNAGNKFYIARINLTEDVPWLFSRLRLDPSGRLIAEQKQTNVCYEIDINTANISKLFAIDDVIDNRSEIEITLEKMPFQAQEKNKIKLASDKENSDEIYFSSNNLHLLEKDLITNAVVKNRLKLPLPPEAEICSAAKEVNQVKLSLKIAGVAQIRYFSPRHVDKKNHKITHLSHKPPQSFHSGTGDDSHEKVFSGQPFDDIRWSHFSSKNIPLFSSVIDNFRVNVGRAKHHRYLGQETEAVLALADAVDPGVRCLTAVIGQQIKSKISSKTKQSDLHSISDNLAKMKNFIQGNKMNEIISSTTDYFDKADSLAEKMKFMLSLLEVNDSISLKDEKSFSCFFGIAKAGLPLVSGWFAGALVRLLTHHSLTFRRNENNDISFNFIKRDANSLIFMAGTGQGLEDKAKFLSANHVDYGTLLPVEANLILVLNRESENNFSFEMKCNHLSEFLQDLFDPGDQHQHITRWQKNGSLSIEHSMGLTLLAEAKSELRAQVGFMANPSTFMVLPRTALGMAEAVNFFELADKHHEKINFADNSSKHFHWVEERYPDFSMTLFREAKIMPIPMTGIGSSDGKIYCYPLPLMEESKQRLPYTDNRLLRHYRLNDTDLQFKLEPWTPAEPDMVKTLNKAVAIAAELQPTSDHSGESRPNASYKAAAELIDFIQEKLNLTDKGEHGYQSIKPAKSIGDFVLSRGDYQQNLKLIRHSVPHKDKTNDTRHSSALKEFLKSLKVWRKNTTLGEYLAVKSKQIKAYSATNKPQLTVFDFICSIEKYAARNERYNNRKSSAVIAIATYRLPEHTVKSLKKEFNALSLAVKEKIVKGQPIMEEYQQLAELRGDLAMTNPASKARYQLDNIALVRQSAVAIETSTLPCTILQVSRKKELVHSKSLSSIKFEYREGEIFPYRLDSSLNIMPDMWY